MQMNGGTVFVYEIFQLHFCGEAVLVLTVAQLKKLQRVWEKAVIINRPQFDYPSIEITEERFFID